MDAAFGKNDLLLRLMAASNERARLLANNVANQNTPGYTRQVLHFEELLRNALDSGENPNHVQPRVGPDTLTPSKPDGNNVNIELEMNTMRENRLLYEAYASILSTRFEMLRASIDESR